MCIRDRSVDEKADYMIGQIADIVKVTNIPTDLTEFGVKMEDLDFLVQAGSEDVYKRQQISSALSVV